MILKYNVGHILLKYDGKCYGVQDALIKYLEYIQIRVLCIWNTHIAPPWFPWHNICIGMSKVHLYKIWNAPKYIYFHFTNGSYEIQSSAGVRSTFQSRFRKCFIIGVLMQHNFHCGKLDCRFWSIEVGEHEKQIEQRPYTV